MGDSTPYSVILLGSYLVPIRFRAPIAASKIEPPQTATDILPAKYLALYNQRATRQKLWKMRVCRPPPTDDAAIIVIFGLVWQPLAIQWVDDFNNPCYRRLRVRITSGSPDVVVVFNGNGDLLKLLLLLLFNSQRPSKQYDRLIAMAEKQVFFFKRKRKREYLQLTIYSRITV